MLIFNSKVKAGLLLCLLLCCLFAFSTPGFARKEAAFPLEKWQVSNEENKEFIVHDPWDFFLKRFVIVNPDGSGLNYIDFSGIGEKERAEITSYIQSLEAIKISTYSKQEQLPYWINLYNALMVRLIAEHYPNIKTINDIKLSEMYPGDGPWYEKITMVEGEKLSLMEISHHILGQIWKNPEIHYALYEGSIGSPSLQYDAYTSENLNFLLYRGAAHFINHPRAVWIDKDGKLTLSSLYQKYPEDFGGNVAAIIEHLKKYADEDLKQKLDKVKSVEKYSFDWTLNAWKQEKKTEN